MVMIPSNAVVCHVVSPDRVFYALMRKEDRLLWKCRLNHSTWEICEPSSLKNDDNQTPFLGPFATMLEMARAHKAELDLDLDLDLDLEADVISNIYVLLPFRESWIPYSTFVNDMFHFKVRWVGRAPLKPPSRGRPRASPTGGSAFSSVVTNVLVLDKAATVKDLLDDIGRHFDELSSFDIMYYADDSLRGRGGLRCLDVTDPVKSLLDFTLLPRITVLTLQNTKWKGRANKQLKGALPASLKSPPKEEHSQQPLRMTLGELRQRQRDAYLENKKVAAPVLESSYDSDDSDDDDDDEEEEDDEEYVPPPQPGKPRRVDESRPRRRQTRKYVQAVANREMTPFLEEIEKGTLSVGFIFNHGSLAEAESYFDEAFTVPALETFAKMLKKVRVKSASASSSASIAGKRKRV